MNNAKLVWKTVYSLYRHDAREPFRDRFCTSVWVQASRLSNTVALVVRNRRKGEQLSTGVLLFKLKLLKEAKAHSITMAAIASGEIEDAYIANGHESRRYHVEVFQAVVKTRHGIADGSQTACVCDENGHNVMKFRSKPGAVLTTPEYANELCSRWNGGSMFHNH